ncbi:MAG: hypothetical protein IAE94_15370 [Chthoniobacterales bacterium]|nr:hypothetical protein [Chthoniobacterales bacterium]
MPHPVADTHTSILEDYFFHPIDRGIGADETPLFTLLDDGRPLHEVIASRFQCTESEAKAAVEYARQEVWL